MPLTSKAFEVLVVLVQHCGEVLEKEELIQKVWPNQIIEDANLTVNMSALRKALGETPSDRRYIVTVPGRGYQFVADIREVSGDDEALFVEEFTSARLVVQQRPAAQGDELELPLEPRALPAGTERRQRPRRTVIIVAVSIAVAVSIYAIQRLARQSGADAIDSIAVLPFANINADGNAEFLADGIAENLINRLSRLSKLRVVPRSTAFRYKGQEVDVEKAGRDLGVRAVVTGRVIQTGDNLNIQVELVDIRKGSQVWGQPYNRRLEDIISVEEQILTGISSRLGWLQTEDEKKKLMQRYTDNSEAYQAYLKGRFHWNKRNEKSVMKGIEYFELAIKKDPQYALAYSGLADSYYVINSFRSPEILSEQRRKALEAARRAIELDDSLAEAHTSLGATKERFEWDWAGAETEFQRALELNPNYAEAHQRYGVFLGALGRFDQSISEIKRALQLEPTSLAINSDLAFSYYLSRRYDEAMEQARKALEIDYYYPRAHANIAACLEQKGMYQEAIGVLDKLLTRSNEVQDGRDLSLFARFQLARVLARAGRKAEARTMLTEILNGLEIGGHFQHMWISGIYVALGENDQAIGWLEKGYQARGWGVFRAHADPMFEGIRDDPRFVKIMREAGLEN